MKLFAELLKELREATGSNEKKEVLARNSDCQEFLLYTLNSFKMFNVTSNNIEFDEGTKDLKWNDAKLVLDRLANRTVTGHAAIAEVQELLNGKQLEQIEAFLCCLDKDLKAGVGEALVNKVFKGLIPTFDVQLCEKYDDLEKLPFKNTFVSRKLDGVRTLAICRNGEWEFLSRKGKEFKTLGILKTDLQNAFGATANFVLDGEVCLRTPDGADDFTGIVSEIKRKDHTIENPLFYIFDVLSLEDFEKQTSETKFRDRYSTMLNLQLKTANFKSFKFLEQWNPSTPAALQELMNIATEKKWEGLIAKNGDVVYEGKRTKNLLKIKKFYEHEFEVTGYYEGEGEFVGTLGGLTVKGTFADGMEEVQINSDVGSGFKVDQRHELWKNRENLIGKTVTLGFFEVSKNKKGEYSLRFPTFKHFYENGRDI